MSSKITSVYSLGATGLLYFLLLVTPLARGSVHLWLQTLIMTVACLLIALLLIEKGRTGRPAWYHTPLDKPILALVFLAVATTLFSRSRADSFEALALLFSYIAIYYAVLHLVRTREEQRRLVYLLLAIGLLLGGIAFLKSIGITLSIWTYEELSYNPAMLSGVYGNHNHLAGYLEMVLPFGLVLYVTRTRRGLPWLGLTAVVTMLVLSHIGTLSRGGWTALILSITFMTLVLLFHAAFKRKRLLLTLFSSALLVVLLVLSSSDIFDRALTLTDDETVLGMGGRVIIWEGTVDMFQDNPVLGTGPGTFATVFPKYQPPGSANRFYQAHNDYLQYLAELGILFVPLALWFFIALYQVFREKMRSRSRQTWGIALGAMSGVVALLAHSVVDFNLHIPANAILFSVLIALVAGGPRQVVKKG